MMQIFNRNCSKTATGYWPTTDAAALAQSWLGDGYRLSKNGKALISADGLRQFRLAYKPKQGKFQANFEKRVSPRGEWTSNGHVDIK